jgi:uncharacterized membrane protein
MQLLLYCVLLVTQVAATIAFARAAQGHRVVILEAEGALPLTPAGGWVRAFGSATAAALMVIGLASHRWIGWDVGVMVVVVFFFLEVRRLRQWSGLGKIMAYVVSVLVLLFSLIDLITHL